MVSPVAKVQLAWYTTQPCPLDVSPPSQRLPEGEEQSSSNSPDPQIPVPPEPLPCSQWQQLLSTVYSIIPLKKPRLPEPRSNTESRTQTREERKPSCTWLLISAHKSGFAEAWASGWQSVRNQHDKMLWERALRLLLVLEPFWPRRVLLSCVLKTSRLTFQVSMG